MSLTEFYAQLKCKTVWQDDLTFSQCGAQTSIRGVRKDSSVSSPL